LKAVKKSNSTDENYKGASFLEMLLFILQSAKIKVYYYDGKIYFSRYYAYSPPSDDDIYSYLKRHFPEYDFVSASLQSMPPADYDSTWTEDDLEEEEYKYPAATQGNENSYQIMNSFKYYWQRHEQGVSYKIVSLEYSGHKTFTEQFTELIWNWISAFGDRIDIKTVPEYSEGSLTPGLDCLANNLDWKNRQSIISYGVE